MPLVAYNDLPTFERLRQEGCPVIGVDEAKKRQAPKLLRRLQMLKLRQSARSVAKLEQVDWEDAEQGIYPKSQLFEAPWIEWAKHYPRSLFCS